MTMDHGHRLQSPDSLSGLIKYLAKRPQEFPFPTFIVILKFCWFSFFSIRDFSSEQVLLFEWMSHLKILLFTSWFTQACNKITNFQVVRPQPRTELCVSDSEQFSRNNHSPCAWDRECSQCTLVVSSALTIVGRLQPKQSQIRTPFFSDPYRGITGLGRKQRH